MPNRQINSRSRLSSQQLGECLGSLFALELLAPSPELFLISPWISDMPLMSNRFGQLRGVLPDSGKDRLGLADALSELVARGARVYIMYREGQDDVTRFLGRLPAGVELQGSADLHEKGLITHQFYLRGSMNFTYSGVNLNQEHVELTTDPTDVARALTEARALWRTTAP